VNQSFLSKASEGKMAIGMKVFGETSDDRERHMLNAGTFTAYKHYVGELEKLIFVDEAWMSPAREEFIQPSKDPNRVETLIINSLNPITQEQTMICFEMIRDSKKKLISFKQMSLPGGSTVQGRLLPAFLKGYQFVQPTTS
jgi:hypothetical protein